MADKSKQPVFVASNDAQILYHHLRDQATTNPDQVITYASLTAAIQRDVQGSSRALLNTARKMAEKDDHMVFVVVRGQGLRLVPNDQLHKVAAAHRQRAGNQAKKGLRTLQSVDLSQLDNDTRLRTVAEATVLRVQAQAAKPGTVKKLQGTLQAGQDMVPLLEATVRMFK